MSNMKKANSSMVKWIYRLFGGAVMLLVTVPAIGFVLLQNLDLNGFKPKIERVLFDALGREVTIKGDVGIVMSMTPTLTVSHVTLANPAWAGKDPMISVGSVVIKVDMMPLLDKHVQIREILLDDMDVALAKNAKAVSNWEFSPVEKEDKGDVPSKPLPNSENPLTLQVNHLQLSNVRLRYDDARFKRHVAIQISDASFDIQKNMVANISMISGDVNAKLQVTSVSLEAFLKGNADISLALDGDDVHIKLDGTLSDFMKTQKFLCKLDAQAESLSAFSTFVGEPLPTIESSRISATLVGTPQNIEFKNVQGSYGDMGFSGNAQLALGGKVPAIKAQVKIPTVTRVSTTRVDVTKPAQKAENSGVTSSGRMIPDAPLKISTMDGVNADVTLDIGEVTGDVSLKDIHAAIVLRGGVLTIAPLRLMVQGAPVASSLSVKPQGSGVAVAAMFEGKDVALGALLKNLKISDNLDGGQANLYLQLSGAGDTVYHVLPTLSGSVVMLMEKAVYHGGPAMQQSANFLQLLTGKGQSSDVTISCLATKMNVVSGVARPEWMVFETGNARVDGTGDVNIGNESLALKLYPRAKKQGLSAITLPVKVVGTFAKPSVVPDAQASVAMLAKAALEIGGKGKNVAAISQSISQKFDVSAQTSPCLSVSESADAVDTAASLKDLAKEKRGEIKEQVKTLKQDFKNIKDLKDPAAIGNTIENLKGLKLF